MKKTKKLDSILIGSIVFVSMLFFLVPTFFMAKSYWNYQWIQKNGTPTIGEITKITDSNTAVNDIIQKNIEIRYLDQIQEIKSISPDFLTDKKIGDEIELRYNPKDNTKIALSDKRSPGMFYTFLVLLFLFAVPSGFWGKVKYDQILEKRKFEQLLRFGSIGTATVSLIIDQESLEVDFLGKKRLIENIPSNLIKKMDLYEGKTVSVKYNPQDHYELILFDPKLISEKIV